MHGATPEMTRTEIAELRTMFSFITMHISVYNPCTPTIDINGQRTESREERTKERERERGQIAAEYFRRNVHFVRCIRNDGDDDDDDVGRTSDANVRHTACSKSPAKKRQSVRGSHPSSYAISLYNIFSVQFLLQIIIILLESLRRIKKTPHTLDQLLARSLASTQWLICVYRKADCIAGMQNAREKYE